MFTLWVFELVSLLKGCFLFIQQTSVEYLLWESESTGTGALSLCSLEMDKLVGKRKKSIYCFNIWGDNCFE